MKGDLIYPLYHSRFYLFVLFYESRVKSVVCAVLNECGYCDIRLLRGN